MQVDADRPAERLLPDARDHHAPSAENEKKKGPYKEVAAIHRLLTKSLDPELNIEDQLMVLKVNLEKKTHVSLEFVLKDLDIGTENLLPTQRLTKEACAIKLINWVSMLSSPEGF